MPDLQTLKQKSSLHLSIYSSKGDAGAAAARCGAAKISEAIYSRRVANIVLATGASQFEMLAQLVTEHGIDWSKVTIFHLDEYVGLPISHPGSFRKYLWERFYSRLPVPVKNFYFLDGEDDCYAECKRVGEIINKCVIDVAFVGIGENGHLAFNDPPADFNKEAPFHVVDLDHRCRSQQYDEGWFDTLDSVPRQAMSMTISQIMKSRCIVCTVSDTRKAEAVRNALEGNVSPTCPASILQSHNNTEFFLDQPAASLLTGVRQG